MEKKFKRNVAFSILGLSLVPFTQVGAAEDEEKFEQPEAEEIVALSEISEYSIISERNVNYAAQVTKPWSINSEPWGTQGSELILHEAHDLIGSTIEVIQEKTTEKSTYALIKNGNNTIGWIDVTGLQKHTVSATNDVNYIIEVTQPWSINSEPWGIEGYQLLENASIYFGEKLNVIQEKKTNRSTYLLLQKNEEIIGWIDQTGVKKYQDILSVRNTNYAAKIINPWSINTAPHGTSEAKTIHATSHQYLNSVVQITQEKRTPESTYALIAINGNELGWINITALEKQTVLSTKDVNYQAELTQAWSINSKPWGVEGYTTNYNSSTEFLNKIVTITQEQVTPRSTYALISINGQQLGWIDKDALNLHPILSTKDTNYKAKIVKPWSINTKPWGTTGYKTIVNDSSYVGKTLDIIQEKQTPKSTYGLIQENGKEIGWIDVTGLEKIEVLSTKDVSYAADITKPWSINTAPWGTEGSKVIEDQTSFVGETVLVTQEKVTPRATYSLISINGKEIGWIDTGAVDKHTVNSTRNVYYSVKLTRPWSINTKPWGIEGFKEIPNAESYVGGHYDVIEEKVTSRGTYGLLSKTGVNIGWVDLTGVNKTNTFHSMKKVNYAATVTRPWSINTEPWGTEGFETVHGSAEAYVGKHVDITAEKVTKRATYALISQNGNLIGWIDTGALTAYTTHSTKNVYYSAKIEKPWSINTKPWGVYGFEPIANYTSYVGDTVKVLQETTTQKSTYALIEKDGKTLGWIDTTGIREIRPVIYLDPGHGGTDPGAVGYLNGKKYKEADLNLQVSLKIRNLLEKEGYTVIMSRETDRTVGLYDRPRMANETDASLFVSVHFNALANSGGTGIETFYYQYSSSYPSQLGNELHNDPNRLRESADLAKEIHNSLISTTGAVDRGLKRASFVVVREARVPSVLLELGFMTNPLDLAKMIRNDYQNDLAQSVVTGINRYHNKR